MQAVHLNSIGAALALLSALAASVVVHEAGHLAPALFFRFEFLGFSAGPMRFLRWHGKWTIEVDAGRLFTSSISAVPRDERRWRERMLAVVSGGPLATLLCAVIAIVLTAHTAAPSWQHTFLLSAAQLNAFIFVLGLIPNSAASRTRNDARLFWSILRNGKHAEEMKLYHRAMRLRIAGVRPREYPHGFMAELQAFTGTPAAMIFFAGMIAAWAMDSGNLARAEANVRRTLDLANACDHRTRNQVLASAAFFEVAFCNNVQAAKQIFTSVNFNGLSPCYFRHRIRAAYALTERNVPQALAEISRAAYTFPNRAPYYAFERELLTRLHRLAIDFASNPAPAEAVIAA